MAAEKPSQNLGKVQTPSQKKIFTIDAFLTN